MTERSYRSVGKRVYTSMIAVVVMIMCAASVVHTVFAEANTLDLVVSSGELRNTQKVSLTVANEQVQQSVLEVTHTDGRSFEAPVEVRGSSGQTSISLVWDTRTVPDGRYLIKYTAKINDEWVSLQSKEVIVANDWPLVTLQSVADGRTISGFVSRDDVTFRFSVDSKAVAMTPTVAETARADGMFGWSALLPISVDSGLQTVKVFATKKDGGRESNETSQTIVLAAVPPPKGDGVGGPVSLPAINLVQEIGQFIAPIIPESVRTTLFGVEVDDLTNNPPQQQNVAPSVLGVAQSKLINPSKAATSDTTPGVINASDKGWQIFGIAWYWWATAIIIIIASIAATLRSIGRRQRQVTSVNIPQKVI